MGIRDGLARLLGVESRSAGYTATIQQAVGRAIRDPGAGAASTAAVEYGLGLLARAFAVADVSPALPALDAVYRAGMICDLIGSGNHLALVQVRQGRVLLRRASQWDVDGGPDPETWIYRLTLPGPTRTDSVSALSGQVVHVRWQASSDLPWQGVSPLAAAGITADLLARIEGGLRDEHGALTRLLLTHPGSYLPNDGARAGFGKGLADAERQVLVDAGNAGWRKEGSGAGSWEQVRIGPEPPPAELTLREQVQQEILSAMGIPAGLYTPREGAVSREAYRQLLSACVLPYAEACLDELRLKLDLPELRFGFHRLAAADVAARARAYGSLTQAGVSPQSAARIAGIEDAELEASAPEPEDRV